MDYNMELHPENIILPLAVLFLPQTNQVVTSKERILTAQPRNALQQLQQQQQKPLQIFQICNHQALSDKMRLQHHIWANEIGLNAITGSWSCATMLEKTVK